MSLATACYVRDTALNLHNKELDITKRISNWSTSAPAIYTGGTK